MNCRTFSCLVFHIAITVTYLCALIEFQNLPPFPHQRPQDQYAGRWKYLTYWNLVCHFLFFIFSCVVDLLKPSAPYHRKLTKLRDGFFAGIVMPYGMFVAMMFWTLYAIDRELIFPKVLDGIFPAWLNQVAHTVILPVLLVEAYFVRHRHPPRKEGLVVTTGFGLFYAVWVLYLALVKDLWPYPILFILNWTQRVAFFAAGLAFLSLLYLVGETVNKVFWGERVKSN